MFHFPRFALANVTMQVLVKDERVSPFGDLRIKGYKPPPRSLSQAGYVLHRCPKPRHPPRTLNVSCAET